MAPMTRRARRAFAEPPTDVLFDVFLLLSAKELCRLRVVCRAWRSLTCDPQFIRAHAALHQGDPLYVASFLTGEQMRVDLIYLSGKTVKRLASGIDRGGQVLCPRLGLVFVANKSDNTYCVLDPAAAYAGSPVVAPRSRLPVLPAPSHRGPGSRGRLREAATSFAFGRVAATGEHKVLCIFHGLKDYDGRPEHLFEVLTLGVGGCRHGRARWRDMPSPDMFVCPDSSTVVDRVVYFLRNNAVYKNGMAALRDAAGGIVVPPPALDCVASFDLEREEWRKRLEGPINMGYDGGDDSDDELDDLDYPLFQFALAELEGSLVLLQHHDTVVTDLWILTDFERGVWVKECSIRPDYPVVSAYVRRPKPLFVLDDGRLVVRERVEGELAVGPTIGHGLCRDLFLMGQLVSTQAVSWVYTMHGDTL